MFKRIVVTTLIAFTVRPVRCAVPIDKLCHLGGFERSYSITVDGNYAYWGTDKGVIILNVSQPSRPAQLGRVDLGDAVTGITARDNLVFCAANRNGLVIIDVSNPANPRVIGQRPTSFACDVKVDGDYAYIADGVAGLRVIDVSDPNEPNIIASCKPDDEYIFAHHIAVSNSIAYITDESFKKVYIIEVSQPNSPVLLSTYYSQEDTHGIAVRGNYAYVATRPTGLNILDVSNPNEPVSIAVYDTEGSSYGIALSGDYALVSDMFSGSSDSGSVNLIDIYDPYNPWLVSSYMTGEYARCVAARDNLVFVVNAVSGFDILEFDFMGILSRRGRFIMSRAARGVNLTGHQACMVDEYKGAHFFDISNPSAPACFGGYDPYSYNPDYPADSSSVIIDDYAYISFANMADIIQITDLVNPISEYVGFFIGGVSNMKAEDNIVYAATEFGLEIMGNIWQNIGYFETTGNGLDLVKDGNNVYVADGSGGLQIIEVSNPAEPCFVGSCDTNGTAYGVDKTGTMAVIADYDAGLKTISVSDPCNPAIIGSCAIPGAAMDVAITGSFACVAGADSGLQVVRIDNPAEPNVVNSYDTAGSARCIESVGKITVFADGVGGFQIVRIGLPADLEPDGDVDMDDLFMFCMNWPRCDCEKPFGCNNADINNNTAVDFVDFALFASEWRECP